MKAISTIFDRMDKWRHFPNYQLERRADIFFSLYLHEVLQVKLGFSLHPELIPEFPVRIGTIYPKIPIDKSYKIDYVALSDDFSKVVFVELKTEGMSRRKSQDDYLVAAKEKGFNALLGGLLDIFRATNSKRKYFRLLEHLETMGALFIPDTVKTIMAGQNLQGVNEASRQIEIKIHPPESMIIYVQPNGEGPDVVSFNEFADIIQENKDDMSRRFVESLREWADFQAGEKPL